MRSSLQNIRQAGGQTGADTQAPIGLLMGTGTRVLANEKIHNQGNIITTDNALDLAIDGDGFFQISQQDGTIAYSRDGGFKLSNLGQLVTSNGDLLQPVITLPPNTSSVTIGRDGIVSVELFAGQGQQVLGQIQISRFLNNAGLQYIQFKFI